MSMSGVCLITIVDGVSTTSIPINEFVLYRFKKRLNYRQIIVTRILNKEETIDIPDGIPVISLPSSLISIRKTIKDIVRDCHNRGEKVIFHLHHQKSALLFYTATIFMGLNRKTLFTVHSFYSHRDIRYKISSCICSLLSNYTNCVSCAAYNDYPKIVRKLKGDKMRVVVNGIDCQRIEIALRGEGQHNDVCDLKKMVCVDRIIPIKNQKFIIGLMKALPDMKLIMVGKEDEKREIRRFAEEEGVVDRIQFKGLVQRDEVYKIINKCCWYVSASTVEGLHLSVLEAMKVGAIPIISEIPAHLEISVKCHHLFKPVPLNEQHWITTIQNYMSTDKTALRSLSDRLSMVVTDEFSLDKMHDQYDEIYNLIVNREC